MTNLSQFDQQPQDPNVESGYASDVGHPSGRSGKRKRAAFLIFDFTISYQFKPKLLKIVIIYLIIFYPFKLLERDFNSHHEKDEAIFELELIGFILMFY